MVNIKTFEKTEIVVPGRIIPEIFKLQRSLVSEYAYIEKFPELDANYALTTLQTKVSQNLLKNFSQRVMEELAEFLDARSKGEVEHSIEEIADATHFYFEILILSGIHENDFDYNELLIDQNLNGSTDFCIVEFMRNFLMSVNLLKNKSWKKTEYLSDERNYRKKLVDSLPSFFNIFRSVGLNRQDIFMAYKKKNLVNLFRIRSKY